MLSGDTPMWNVMEWGIISMVWHKGSCEIWVWWFGGWRCLEAREKELSMLLVFSDWNAKEVAINDPTGEGQPCYSFSLKKMLIICSMKNAYMCLSKWGTCVLTQEILTGFVSICWGFHNKTPLMGALSNRNLSHSLEARSPKSRCCETRFFWGSEEKSAVGHTPWLIDGHLHVPMPFSLFKTVSAFPFI